MHLQKRTKKTLGSLNLNNAKSFKDNGYLIIPKILSGELLDFIGIYAYNRARIGDGAWMEDPQAPNTPSFGYDYVMENLSDFLLPKIESAAGMRLLPTYTYFRVYKAGDILEKHRDRPSCEISTTLNLGGDPWPIFIDETGSNNVIDEYKNIHKPNAPKGTSIDLDVGDMLIYEGCDFEHWREPFQGQNCGQVFLHYNNVNGPQKDINVFDKRSKLGIPKWELKNT